MVSDFIDSKKIDELKKFASNMIKGKIGCVNSFQVISKHILKGRIAEYKNDSQLHDELTIVINQELPQMMIKNDIPKWKLDEIITDSIYHEYGHSIIELEKGADQYHVDDILSIVDKNFKDEEEFAEDFKDYIRFDRKKEVFDPIIKQYCQTLKDIS